MVGAASGGMLTMAPGLFCANTTVARIGIEPGVGIGKRVWPVDIEFYIVAIKHHIFRCEISVPIHTMAYRNLRSSP